ncbi:MAG: M20/M25/M40 family metallo-hydrolase [Nitrosopumilus sp.]|nr:M20/M25/M40 family metallo-hydrolase [Nitrosopumilus sp.]MDF2423060.1 M20/M25/M40 family metallo-hydrolase [Nitrosopumilus sp.]MDF2424310.1 M20/M25/M40 family metallo-hydrolase [Nitrosopumilus sp.]MDF2425334.1 M20/M25/M40 family metallo-hydrolase [Nitrosopumilus sp.]MDF2427122.1 M20/M25/M40 family metallo-hydrolase [Nitrosopumilus sp.]
MDPHFTVTSRYAVKMLEKSLRLYTPSLSEKPMAEFLADKCDDLGFEDIQIDEVGNIIAKKGSGSPRIMLCGHMDVVPGKVKVRKEGDSLYGRGASDAKAPLMAMLFAAASIQNNNGTVYFVGAVDEEGNATGIKNLVKKKMDIDYAIFGEPSGIKQVTIAYKGRLAINLKISVEDSSHASAPWLSKNAILESMIFARELKEKLEADQEGKSKGMLLTATMTEVKGGTSHNVTPKECETTFDIRIPVDMNCKTIEQKIATLVKEISQEREVEAFYSILDETEPFEAPHDSALVRAFTLGVMEVEHSRPTLIRKTGTGDMNVLGNQWKIPVVTYGPGDPHEAHTIDEKVSIDEYLRGIEILKKTLQHLKRLHDKNIQ